MPPKLVGDMSAADLEQYQIWLEYQKPMMMTFAKAPKGIWGRCGRCGAHLIQLMGLTENKGAIQIVFTAGMDEWPKHCRNCGQRIQRGTEDE